MKRPARYLSRRGLLLVEAVLSAVVIAVGLVYVTRGLGGQLKAIRTIEDQEDLLAVARGRLLELEAKRLFGRPLPPDPEGTLVDPSGTYHCTMLGVLRQQPTDQAGNPVAQHVVIAVQRDDRPSTTVRHAAIWPMDWVPSGWQ